MRMNERGGMTAADVVNRYDEEALARLFYLYGEMKTAAVWLRPLSRNAKPRPSTPLSNSSMWSNRSWGAKG